MAADPPLFPDVDETTLSDRVIEGLYADVAAALAADDGTPWGEAKPHDVRRSDEWRAWAARLERELDRRGLAVARLAW